MKLSRKVRFEFWHFVLCLIVWTTKAAGVRYRYRHDDDGSVLRVVIVSNGAFSDRDVERICDKIEFCVNRMRLALT